jgi:GT2 family glycosyltransferase
MNNKNPLISIIIVNWNGQKWLAGCLESLSKQLYTNIEIIIIDNASVDNSVKWIKNKYPKIKVIELKKNEGFSIANNLGFQKAKGEYILFLNNDTKVTPYFLIELVTIFENNLTIGGAQSKLLLMDNPTKLDAIGAFLTNTGFLYHYAFHEPDSPRYDKQIDLYTVKGASMIFRKDVLDKVSINGCIFDPAYFAYFEETDLCHRIWLAGYRIVYAYKSVVYHKSGGTSTNINNLIIQYHSFKNRINSYLSNLGWFNLLLILPLHLILCEGFAFVGLIKGKYNLFVVIQRAIAWNFFNIRTVYSKRKYIQQKVRKQSDSEIITYILKSIPINYYYSMLLKLDMYQQVNR